MKDSGVRLQSGGVTTKLGMTYSERMCDEVVLLEILGTARNGHKYVCFDRHRLEQSIYTYNTRKSKVVSARVLSEMVWISVARPPCGQTKTPLTWQVNRKEDGKIICRIVQNQALCCADNFQRKSSWGHIDAM